LAPAQRAAEFSLPQDIFVAAQRDRSSEHHLALSVNCFGIVVVEANRIFLAGRDSRVYNGLA
jgi:hypothetical protein